MWWLPYINKGDVVIDIGANVGEVSEPLLEAVGETGSVYAIEPGPKAFSILKSIQDKHYNFFPFQIAMGDRNGKMWVYHYRHWTLLPVDVEDPRYVNRKLHPGQRKDLKEEFEVEYLTLDSFVHLYGVPRVSAIKIDVNGASYSVVNGGLGLLTRSKPLLVVELGTEQPEHNSPAETLGVLASIGYRFITGRGDVTAEKITRELGGEDTTADVLCLAK